MENSGIPRSRDTGTSSKRHPSGDGGGVIRYRCRSCMVIKLMVSAPHPGQGRRKPGTGTFRLRRALHGDGERGGAVGHACTICGPCSQPAHGRGNTKRETPPPATGPPPTDGRISVDAACAMDGSRALYGAWKKGIRGLRGHGGAGGSFYSLAPRTVEIIGAGFQGQEGDAGPPSPSGASFPLVGQDGSRQKVQGFLPRLTILTRGEPQSGQTSSVGTRFPFWGRG